MTDVEKDISELRLRYATLVRELRVKAELTQESLGEAVGMHRTYINHFEAGRVSIKLDNLEKLLRYLAPEDDSRSYRTRLAENVKLIRGYLTQEAFAAKLELPVLFISRVERAVFATSIDHVAKLADRLKVSGEYLLT